jgi:deoxyhypusine synthase
VDFKCFLESTNLDGKCLKIEGHDFNRGVDYHQLLKSMLTTGFQASNLAEAIESVHQMVLFYDTHVFFVIF